MTLLWILGDVSVGKVPFLQLWRCEFNPDTVMHTHNPSTAERQTDGSLRGTGQPAQPSQWAFQISQTSWMVPEEWHPRLPSGFHTYVIYAHMCTCAHTHSSGASQSLVIFYPVAQFFLLLLSIITHQVESREAKQWRNVLAFHNEASSSKPPWPAGTLKRHWEHKSLWGR